uniref:ER membrane protein complex subunit 1 n=1 Tax=Glossina pallidipes TaxID=7398 RepID=A0A1A9Z6J0_GLOPL
MHFKWRSCLRLLAVLFAVDCVQCLYEDQIKKFDWRSLHLGGVEKADLDLNGFQPRLLVSTRENVLASLCPETGELMWRQVFESGIRGDIKLMQISSTSTASDNTAAARISSSHGFDMLTVQGHNPALIRGWNSNMGLSEWEWSLMPLQSGRAIDSFWFYSKSMLYHVLPIWQSHLEVTQYFASSGQPLGNTAKIAASWIDKEKCTLSGIYYTCLEKQQLITLDLTADQPKIMYVDLENVPAYPLKNLEGASGVLIVDKKLVAVKNDIPVCKSLLSQSYIVGNYKKEKIIINADVKDKILYIQSYSLESCEPLAQFSSTLSYPEHLGIPTLKAFDCKSSRNSNDENCLFIFDTTDDSIVAVRQSKILWIRSEALANVVSAEFVDLPLTDNEGVLENEMKGKAADIMSAFLHRITSQIMHVKSLLLHVIGLGPKPSDTQRAGLVRDAFGLHKMLVVLTKSGKIFGIDNISGKHHWQYFLHNVEHFANDQEMRLLVQRTSKHFPLSALCTVVAKDKLTGNGVLLRFNPITGQTSEGGLLKLTYKIKQLTLLTETDNDFVKGLLIIDAEDRVHVYPEYATKKANGIYMFTAQKDEATLNGFFVQYENKELTTLPLWNVDLSGHNGDHKIISIASKNPLERVHSQGRVMPDRSVLYKYINPNLVAVFTLAKDDVHKFLMYVYLIDVVSGSVVFTMMHRKVRPPLHAVHSENWLAYAYYNDKVRRVEIIGTSKGSILELPWYLLDPRRPIASKTSGREEGAVPYVPELPILTDNIINYNQTISRLRYIHTAPSGLESTCLVVAAGLG